MDNQNSPCFVALRNICFVNIPFLPPFQPFRKIYLGDYLLLLPTLPLLWAIFPRHLSLYLLDIPTVFVFFHSGVKYYSVLFHFSFDTILLSVCINTSSGLFLICKKNAHILLGNSELFSPILRNPLNCYYLSSFLEYILFRPSVEHLA